MKQLDPTETIALGFQVHYTISEGKAISFSSCLDAECSKEDLNRALDKMVDAAERQIARVRIPVMRSELERIETAHQRAKEDIYRIQAEEELSDEAWRHQHNGSGRRGEFKYSPAQIQERNKKQADRQNAEITYQRNGEEIKFRKAALADLERLLAVSSAANSNSEA